MSENYIRNNFDDIRKYADIVEKRLCDEDCTVDWLVKENAEVERLAKAHGIEYLLIDDKYEINI